MGVMNYGSAWDWINEQPNTPPNEICGHCHNCNPLYEDIAARVIRALQLSLSEIRQQEMYQDFPALRFNQGIIFTIGRLYASIDRIKRISGLYAASFQRLEQQMVHIPFVGAAAFASNVVRWEVEDAVRGYTELAIYAEQRNMRSDMNFITRSMLDTVQKVIQGNAVVFVEVFAVFDFCIRHFHEFGKPQTEQAITDFEECLEAFITWWNRVQPGNRMFAPLFGEPPMKDIEVDRERLLKKGIIESLRATRRDQRQDASTLNILNNEQNYTLQEYMYDLIDSWYGDPLEIGLVLRGYRVAAKFSYNRDTDVDDRLIVTYGGDGWISEAEDRYPYTVQVVTRFDDLWYGDVEPNQDLARATRGFLRSQHHMMIADARGY